MDAFETVVAEHGAAVLRVCRAMLGPADADDAWSDTFLAALRAYPSLRPGSNVRAWLITIAQRKSIDLLRKAGRAPLPVGDVPERPAAEGIPAPADEDLWRALAALAPKQRAAVVYHHLGGLPYAEVGALLGTNEAAARRSAADGIANLRTRYLEGADR